MKKAVFTVVAIFLMFPGTTSLAQIHLGAGFLSSTHKSTMQHGSGPSNIYETFNGFFAGGGYDITFAGGFVFIPGVYYSFGYRDITDYLDDWTLKGNEMEQYISIPLPLNYFKEVGYGNRVFVFAGPTFSIGLSSTENISSGTMESHTSEYSNNGSYKRTDFLLGGGVGFELKDMLRFKVEYDRGMVNRIYSKRNWSLHTSHILIGVEYIF